MSTVDAWVLPASVAIDEACLQPGERTCAAAMRSPTAAARHRRGRAALRHVVAGATARLPAALTVDASPAGRPLVAAHGGPWVSVAHAADVVAVALAGDAPAGIDVEVLPPDVARRRPSAAVATPDRVAALQELVGPDIAPLAVWVVLEAALKAAGTGFAQPHTAAAMRVIDGGVVVDLPVGGRHGCRVRVDGPVVAAVAVRGAAVPDVVWHDRLD